MSNSGSRSGSESLYCNVPQGSFIDYKSSLGSIIRKHSVEAHVYPDDLQIYIVFKPDEKDDATDRIETCIQEVHQWMGQNFLKFNDDKTELIIFESPHNLSKVVEIEIAIGDHKINLS